MVLEACQRLVMLVQWGDRPMLLAEDIGLLHKAPKRMDRGKGRGSRPLGQEEIQGWRMSNNGLVFGADTLAHVTRGPHFRGDVHSCVSLSSRAGHSKITMCPCVNVDGTTAENLQILSPPGSSLSSPFTYMVLGEEKESGKSEKMIGDRMKKE